MNRKRTFLGFLVPWVTLVPPTVGMQTCGQNASPLWVGKRSSSLEKGRLFWSLLLVDWDASSERRKQGGTICWGRRGEWEVKYGSLSPYPPPPIWR